MSEGSIQVTKESSGDLMGLPLLRAWELILHALLDDTQGFPVRVRHSIVSRIDNSALEVLEQLITARYATHRRKLGALRRADEHLNRLRVLLRVAHARQYLSHGRFESHSQGLNEAGRMLGGWIKREVSRGGAHQRSSNR
jgi:hypothetical protein